MIVTEDGRTLCYSCYQSDDTAKLDYWMPDDSENYPVTCEEPGCGYVATGPGEGHFPEDKT